jgi:hypothetical protein
MLCSALLVLLLLKDELEITRTIFIRFLARPSLIPVAQQQIHASDSQKCNHFHAKRHRITLDVPWLITSRIDLRGGDTRDVGQGDQQRYPDRPHMLVLQVVGHPSQDESIVWVNTFTSLVNLDWSFCVE